MNPYRCSDCDWKYDVLTMVDRRRAVKRHQLRHVIEQRAQLGATLREAAVRRLIQYGVELRPDLGRFL
jgi:hypothetical protein